MSERSLCIKVKKIHGEKTIALANKLGLSNRELHIQQNANHIFIPLVRQPEENELAKLKTQLPNFELATKVFTKKKQQRKILKKKLKKQISDSLFNDGRQQN